MTEDSGAFKTNLRIPAGFGHNITIPGLRGRDAAPLENYKHGLLGPDIFNNRPGGVAGILKAT
jgi:hypothetical protein